MWIVVMTIVGEDVVAVQRAGLFVVGWELLGRRVLRLGERWGIRAGVGV
jgi:hypothetical protein